MAATPTGRVQPYSTGASFVYLGLGPSKTAQFFGTCEGFPKHERRVDYMQVMNDVSGRRKPMDMSFQGQDATISLAMTVWDEGMAQMLDEFPDFGLINAAGSPGAWRFGDVGALMGFEQLAIPVWIAYGLSGFSGTIKPVYSALPSGYHYLQCIPFAPNTTDEGAQNMIRHIMFYTWPVCNFQNQTFQLFDSNLTSLGLPINGPIAA